MDHGLNRRKLVLSSEGHQDRACAYGGVEAFRKASPGAAVEALGHAYVFFREGLAGDLAPCGPGLLYFYVYVFFRAVGIKELAAEVYYLFAVPVEDQPGIFGDLRHLDSLKVLRGCQIQELLHVARGYYHGHTLLALAYGKFRAVQTFVLLGHRVKIHAKAVRKLAYGNGHAARTEVVAALYKP